jgi:molybdopterin-binding protein
VAIARALAVRPDLLLLDEPTSNIDPESIRAIEAALKEANQRGTTILMSTHNLATAYRLASRVFPMSDGRIFDHPNNVFHGRVDRTDEYFTYFAVGTDTSEPAPRNGESAQIVLAPAQKEPATAAVIPMDDIIVSRERIESSAQNHFAGRVEAVVPYAGGRRVDVDCNGVVLSALVTRYAVEQLALEPGQRVHIAFKASAVKLY